MRESKIKLWLAAESPLDRWDFLPDYLGGPLYLLYNRPRGQAVWPRRQEIRPSLDFVSHSPLRHRQVDLHYVGRSEAAGQTQAGSALPELDDAWLRDAELFRIEGRRVGDARATLEVPDFVIDSERR